MQRAPQRFERAWATGLIVIGLVLLGVVFASAFVIVMDPGEYYDKWVADDGTAGPEASFDWASSGLLVEFTGTSETGDANIERSLWDFGDGAESTDPNPSHRFTEEGEWTVALEVVDENGLSSKAEGTVEVEAGTVTRGDGAIGLSDLADRLAKTTERVAKGGVVVLLVIGMFVVLTMIGGRVVRQGTRMLRPIPDRINLKLRPKELELALVEANAEISSTAELAQPEGPLRDSGLQDGDGLIEPPGDQPVSERRADPITRSAQ